MSVQLECIGCRQIKTFPYNEKYPVCPECREWEEKRRERINRPLLQSVKNLFKRKKKPIPSDIRWTVWERDNFTCQHCGTRKDLTIDHIYPESKGGTLELDNLQTLCKSCNSRKGTS